MTASPQPPPPPPAESGPLPGARLALGLLLAINLFNYLDRQVLAAVVPHLKSSLFQSGQNHGMESFLAWAEQHLGFKPENALIGLLSMAFMLCYMLAAPLFGRLAVRHSRWLIIGLAVMAWSLASGASGLAVTFIGLLLTRCLVGIGEAAYGPAAPALLSDYFPLQVRGRILSVFYLAIPVGSALGYVLGEQVAKSGLGAWAATWLGRETESWRWAFYLVVPPGLALGLWAMFLREPLKAGAPTPKCSAGLRDYLGFFRIPSFVYCTLGMAAMTFAIGGIGFWMPYFLEHLPGKPGSPTTIFGLLTVVAGLAATLAGGWAGDRLRQRFPGSYFLVSGIAMLVGFPLFLAALFAGYPYIWPGIFLACFCLFFNTGPTNTILANVSPARLRPAAFALNILIIHLLGDVISPVIVGLVADRWSLRAGFLLVGLMFLVSGALWLAGARHLARDTARAAADTPGHPTTSP
ncbi:MAG: MFS transporter [Verrucomicrobiae bacterium]|nr:MFS transporter [Verrucomicrobiae bacterium]